MRFCITLAAIAVAGVVVSCGWGAPADVTVMSFNIRYGTADDGENRWENRRDLVFEVIRRESPHLLGLQEALRFQLDEIRAAVPGYQEIGVGRNDGKTSGEYAAVLYRADRFAVADAGTFWLSDTPDIPGSTSWGNTIPRICTWARLVDEVTGRALYIYNVHLDHRSQPSRERSVELLADRIAKQDFPDDPVVVTGDFNAGEDNRAFRYLTGALPRATEAGPPPSPPSPVLTDSFGALNGEAADVGTFNGFEGTTDGARIDAIFVSSSWTLRGAGILRTDSGGRYPSDHFPVTAHLAWPP